MITHILLAFVPVFSLVLIIIFWNSPAVRVFGVMGILVSVFLTLGALVAPHRLAQVRLYDTKQSEEWVRGAGDTAMIVRGVLPTLVTSFVSMSILALFNPRFSKPARHPHDQEVAKKNEC